MGKLFCLVGPSGSGKDTVKRELGIPNIISYRTRPIREGEHDGIDGHFVTDSLYLQHKKIGMIVAETLYAGYRYWTTTENYIPLTSFGSDMSYVVDWEGVECCTKYFGGDVVKSIWFKVDDDELIKRMLFRGDSQEQILHRMRQYHTVDKHTSQLCDIEVDANGPVSQVVERVKLILEEFRDGYVSGVSKGLR